MSARPFKFIILDGMVVEEYAINRYLVLNDFFLDLNAIIFSKKVPHYDLPEFVSEATQFKLKPIVDAVINYIKDVDYPFTIDYEQIGNDYSMNIIPFSPPMPINLCKLEIEPLMPFDKWLMINITDISDYFVATTTTTPAFINLRHEETIAWIIRNLGNSHAHMEFIINTLQTKVLDDFDKMAYPHDDAVLNMLTSSFGAVLIMLIELFQNLNLFDADGRNYWRPSALNRFEVILYDSKHRKGITG